MTGIKLVRDELRETVNSLVHDVIVPGFRIYTREGGENCMDYYINCILDYFIGLRGPNIMYNMLVDTALLSAETGERH